MTAEVIDGYCRLVWAVLLWAARDAQSTARRQRKERIEAIRFLRSEAGRDLARAAGIDPHRYLARVAEWRGAVILENPLADV